MTCPACTASGPRLRSAVNLLECVECGHLWQYERKPFDYGAQYIAAGYAGKPTNDMAWLRLGYLGGFVQSGRVLDIGYGDGAFIRAARRAGFEAFGYDVASGASDVPTVESLSGAWDIVTCFDSLEHFDNPSSVFMVRPSLFLVTIPNLPTGVSDEGLKAWRHYKPDEHLHYFTRYSIRRLFHRHGYALGESAPVEDLIRKAPEGQRGANTMTYIFERQGET